MSRFPLFLLIASLATAQTYKIATAAGGGPLIGQDAISVSINSPEAVAVDTAGNFYVSSPSLNQVYKFSPGGALLQVIGTGFAQSAGDGGLASAAWLNGPLGMAVDSLGNLYIADSVNNAIRKVDATTGNISTLAGLSLSRPAGLAVDAANNLYIADAGSNRVFKVTPAGAATVFAGSIIGFTDNVTATAGKLSDPEAVAVDSAGNVYIADRANNRIRKVTAATGIISTVAGSASAGFLGDGSAATSARLNGPRGVAVDSAGIIYIGDNGNHVIRKVTVADGKIATVIGKGQTSGFAGDGGSASSTAVRILSPRGLAIDSSGDLWITDTGNSRIRKVAAGIIDTVAGSATFSGDGGPGVNAQLTFPQGTAIDSAGNIYIADSASARVRKLTVATGIITTVAGGGTATGNGGQATSAKLNLPVGVALDADDNLYIADRNAHKIRKVDTNGIITTFAGTGTAGFTNDGHAATSAQITAPNGITVDKAGNLYFTNNSRIRKVDPSGIISTIAGSGTSSYTGDGGPAANATLNLPLALATDAAGNLYIADTSNNRVRKIDTSGNISLVVGKTGGGNSSGDNGAANQANTDSPSGVFVDPAGNLLIAEKSGHRIRRVTTASATGIIRTIAGTGTGGYSGDGGPPISATLNNPYGVVADSSGTIWIADGVNYRLRKMAAQVAVDVTSIPAGLDVVVDGNTIATPHAFTWDAGSSHTLNALSQPVSAGTQKGFASWSQGGAASQTVVIPAAGATYTATFNTQYQLILTASPANGGTLSPDAGSYFDADSTVNVTATPGGGYSFTSWSGAANNPGSAATSVRMTGPQSLTATFSPSAATIILGSLTATYDGTPKAASAATDPPALNVSFLYTGIDVEYPASATPPAAAGSYNVTATIVDAIYSGSASGTLTISSADVTVSLGGSPATYDGSPKAVTATTTPVSVSTAVTYTGLSLTYPASSIPPTGAGTYAVTATVNAPGYAGSATGTLTIAKATATVTVTNVDVPYDGAAKFAPVATGPGGLNLIVTYNGSGAVPINAGSYNVLATVDDPNYTGSGAGTMIIQKIDPVLTWSAPTAIAFGSALGAGQLNATANVPGAFVYTPASGAVLPVGNEQALSVSFTPADSTDYNNAIAGTTINVNPAASGPAHIVITKVLSRNGSNDIVMTINLTNNGGSAANNVVLTGAKIGAVPGTPVPQVVGTIAGGSSAQLVVTVPGSVGVSGAASSATINVTFTGGTASSSGRITLP